MTTQTLAEKLATSPSVIRSTAPLLIPHDRRTIDGSSRLVFPGQDAHARYARAWARVPSGRWRRHRERYFDAAFVVRQQRALGRLQLSDELESFERRVQLRRSVFLPHRAGRNASRTIASHHLDWVVRFEEIRDYYERRACAGEAMPSARRLYLEVAIEDYADHAARWSYNPADMVHEAAARVRKAVRPPLNRETKIT